MTNFLLSVGWILGMVLAYLWGKEIGARQEKERIFRDMMKSHNLNSSKSRYELQKKGVWAGRADS